MLRSVIFSPAWPLAGMTPWSKHHWFTPSASSLIETNPSAATGVVYDGLTLSVSNFSTRQTGAEAALVSAALSSSDTAAFFGLYKQSFRTTFAVLFALVAELADAYGSGPYGATRGGSSPLVSTFFQDLLKGGHRVLPGLQCSQWLASASASVSAPAIMRVRCIPSAIGARWQSSFRQRR